MIYAKGQSVAGLAGRRHSRIRETILHLLDRLHCCSAEELISGFSSPKIPHKTTVYRELDCLMSHGLIRELDFGDGKKRYELASDEHHHHLICTSCRLTQPIRIDEDLDNKVRKAASRLGFIVTDHMLEFFGLCRKCRQANQ